MTESGQDSLTRAVWRKSTRSSPTSNDCVEVARNLADIVAVRDSKHPDGPELIFTCPAWAAFVRTMKREPFGL